jgi:hypothetical protein
MPLWRHNVPERWALRGEAEGSGSVVEWRDLTPAVVLARKRSGLTLQGIGEHTGLSNYKTVSIAVRRFSSRMSRDSRFRSLAQKCLAKLKNGET